MKQIIIIAFVFSAFFACKNAPSSSNGNAVSFANKTDFICGMEVQPDWTDTCHYQGKTYAFCAASCKEEFLKDPKKYLDAAPAH